MMTPEATRAYQALTRQLRSTIATCEALACGYRDNHDGSLGCPAAAHRRLQAGLKTALAMITEIPVPATTATKNQAQT